MEEERDLIARATAGDAGAYAELVKRHQRPVYALAMRMLRDHDDADDVAQRAFLRAWQNLAGFEGRCGFRSWVFRICVNLCRNHHRDRRRFVDGAPASREPSQEAVGSDRLEREERMARIRTAVASLPEKQRITVELRVYQSLPFREIALAMETTENAAKVNFHYAVKNLRARVGPATELEPVAGRG